MNRVARYPVLIVGAVSGLVLGAAQLAGSGSVIAAAVTLTVTLGYAGLVTALGRRDDTASTLAGRPVDERWEQISLEASAGALGASAIFVLAAFAYAEATGGAWQPWALAAAVMGVSYIGSLVLVRARH